jgi:hypothetical protein
MDEIKPVELESMIPLQAETSRLRGFIAAAAAGLTLLAECATTSRITGLQYAQASSPLREARDTHVPVEQRAADTSYIPIIRAT